MTIIRTVSPVDDGSSGTVLSAEVLLEGALEAGSEGLLEGSELSGLEEEAASLLLSGLLEGAVLSGLLETAEFCWEEDAPSDSEEPAEDGSLMGELLFCEDSWETELGSVDDGSPSSEESEVTSVSESAGSW